MHQFLPEYVYNNVVSQLCCICSKQTGISMWMDATKENKPKNKTEGDFKNVTALHKVSMDAKVLQSPVLYSCSCTVYLLGVFPKLKKKVWVFYRMFQGTSEDTNLGEKRGVQRGQRISLWWICWGGFVSFTLFLNYLVTDTVFVGKGRGWGARKRTRRGKRLMLANRRLGNQQQVICYLCPAQSWLTFKLLRDSRVPQLLLSPGTWIYLCFNSHQLSESTLSPPLKVEHHKPHLFNTKL